MPIALPSDCKTEACRWNGLLENASSTRTALVSQSSDSATLLFTIRVSRADAAACECRLKALNRLLREREGFRSIEVVRRDDADGADFILLVHFDTERNLEAWKAAPERLTAIAGIESLALGAFQRQQAVGSDIWFDTIERQVPGHARIPFWKRWVLSVIAVYPGLLVLLELAEPLVGWLPRPLSLFLIVVAMTGLMTAFIMPWLMHRFESWLMRA